MSLAAKTDFEDRWELVTQGDARHIGLDSAEEFEFWGDESSSDEEEY